MKAESKKWKVPLFENLMENSVSAEMQYKIISLGF